MQYDGVQYLDQSNVIQFTKNIPFQGKGSLGPIWAKTIQPYVALNIKRRLKFHRILFNKINS